MADDILVTYILSDWIFHFAVVGLILYLVYRDNKKLDNVNDRYEKLLYALMNNVADKQTKYKQEIIENIKDLSTATLKVFSAIENNISEVKNVIAGIDKVTEGVRDVETEVEKVTVGISEVIGFCGGIEYLRQEITKSTTALQTASEEMNKFNKLLLNLEKEISNSQEKEISNSQEKEISNSQEKEI